MDYERLRKALVDYYGTASFMCSPIAVVDIAKVKNATENELIVLAQKAGIDISKYQR